MVTAFSRVLRARVAGQLKAVRYNLRAFWVDEYPDKAQCRNAAVMARPIWALTTKMHYALRVAGRLTVQNAWSSPLTFNDISLLVSGDVH